MPSASEWAMSRVQEICRAHPLGYIDALPVAAALDAAREEGVQAERERCARICEERIAKHERNSKGLSTQEMESLAVHQEECRLVRAAIRSAEPERTISQQADDIIRDALASTEPEGEVLTSEELKFLASTSRPVEAKPEPCADEDGCCSTCGRDLVGCPACQEANR